MSTREMAYNIIDKLSDKQLKGFIAMFGDFYSASHEKDEKASTFEELEKLHRPISNINEDKELSDWRTKKYDI